MTQELVDQIENQKFLTAQREAKEKAEREAKLAIADSVFESEEELTAEDLTPPTPAADPIAAGTPDSGPDAPPAE